MWCKTPQPPFSECSLPLSQPINHSVSQPASQKERGDGQCALLQEQRRRQDKPRSQSRLAGRKAKRTNSLQNLPVKDEEREHQPLPPGGEKEAKVAWLSWTGCLLVVAAGRSVLSPALASIIRASLSRTSPPPRQNVPHPADRLRKARHPIRIVLLLRICCNTKETSLPLPPPRRGRRKSRRCFYGSAFWSPNGRSSCLSAPEDRSRK
jgi:hypothetical protein